MANSSSPDYKELFLKAEEERKWAEEERRREAELREQAEESRRQAEEERRREAELRRQAEEIQRKAEEERDQGREQTRSTTFRELIRHCHNLFSRPLRAEDPSRSTTGKIPAPTGKRCPLQLRPWTDCEIRQQEIYRSVCNYLEPPGQDAEQLFLSRHVLEGFGKELRRPISSEQDLESYERFGVENHVRDIIAALCKKPAARVEFHLSDGVSFDNHANALDPQVDPSQPRESSTSRRSRPDQFCIRRGTSETILTTVEYKPPHKLSVENIRSGLRPMDFWKEVVVPDSIPTQKPEKLRYNAARLTGSALVQEFHVMIQEGLEYSYLTNGLAVVLLRVPYNDPTTLYYHLCEPNIEVNPENDQSFQQPVTSIARVLCLCLMSFSSRLRDQNWRNNARKHLPEWKTSFDHERSGIPDAELRQIPPDAQDTPSVYTSSEGSVSVFLPSSPPESPTGGRRPPTRSQTQCAPSDLILRDHPSESDEDPAPTGPTGQKRRFSRVTSSSLSPSVQRSARQTGSGYAPSGQNQHPQTHFCTQRCLLGLQQGDLLDEYCPNVALHRKGEDGSRHLINAETLVQQIKQQLDEDIDSCTPMGGCGASGAPFKITCAAYGYTVVGKGTTSYLWNEVSREADIYRILSRVQGSVVPVFLGAINLAKIYFLHGAGEIRHMLLMAWAGKPISKNEATSPDVSSSISKSIKKIRSLGVSHHDLRLDNFLWSDELRRVLIIDFHRSALDPQLRNKRMRLPRKISCEADTPKQKRLRLV